MTTTREIAIQTEPFVVNIGPAHPSTHGVFRMLTTLDGEVIVNMEPVFGYLHRGIEKLAEERTYGGCVPLTDRLDYLASMSNNFAYCLAVEKLAGVAVPLRAEYIRVIMAELQRLASHLCAVGFFLNDCGAFMTPVLYMFREREKILDLFDMVCGQRLTYNYMRVGGVSQDLPEEFVPALKKFIKEMPGWINEYERLLKQNEILLARTKGVGILTKEMAINTSASGPVLRASGVKWDLRKADPYSIYDRFEFDIPTGSAGDIRPPAGEAYGRLESPKGELGFYLVSDGSIAPYRFHVRAPTFINLTALSDMVRGWKVADLIIIFGSIDICMGEVDR